MSLRFAPPDGNSMQSTAEPNQLWELMKHRYRQLGNNKRLSNGIDSEQIQVLINMGDRVKRTSVPSDNPEVQQHQAEDGVRAWKSKARQFTNQEAILSFYRANRRSPSRSMSEMNLRSMHKYDTWNKDRLRTNYSPVKGGYLETVSKFNKKKLRWFELQGGKLLQYDQKGGKLKENGTIYLLPHFELRTLESGDGFYFEISTPFKSLTLKAESEKERDSWMKHFESVKATAKSADSTNSVKKGNDFQATQQDLEQVKDELEFDLVLNQNLKQQATQKEDYDAAAAYQEKIQQIQSLLHEYSTITQTHQEMSQQRNSLDQSRYQEELDPFRMTGLQSVGKKGVVDHYQSPLIPRANTMRLVRPSPPKPNLVRSNSVTEPPKRKIPPIPPPKPAHLRGQPLNR